MKHQYESLVNEMIAFATANPHIVFLDCFTDKRFRLDRYPKGHVIDYDFNGIYVAEYLYPITFATYIIQTMSGKQ
jgi:hypothetical protein